MGNLPPTAPRVRHVSRDLGVGIVVDAFKGKPPVVKVKWPEQQRGESCLWGYYRASDLTPEGA